MTGAALDDQWALVRLHEALPLRAHRRVGLDLVRRRQARRARRELAPLRRWPRINDTSYATYGNDSNHVRLHRLLDFVEDGDRVLDVGIGFGYVTGVLLRERRLEHYCGIDVKRHFLDGGVESMAAVNDLDASICDLEIKDVLDVTPEWMAPHRPDVVLLLEVLEHIAEPGRALHTLARSVPSHATILFSVPLLGRLEAVWGHVSLFDRARIEALCEAAGLHVHYVEPLFSMWTLVAASPSADPPPRLRRALDVATPWRRLFARAGRRLPERPAPGYSMRLVPMHHRHDFSRPQDDPTAVAIDARRIGVTCTVGAPASEGGVRLPIPAPHLLRLELTVFEPDAVVEVTVRGLDTTGAEQLRWSWTDRSLRPVDGTRTTHLLRPGASASRFASRAAGDPSAVQAVDVTLRVRPGQTAGFRVHRAAYATPEPPYDALPLPADAARPQ